MERLDLEQLRLYVAVMWEVWNACNQAIFGKRDWNIKELGPRAMAFVQAYKEAQVRSETSTVKHQ